MQWVQVGAPEVHRQRGKWVVRQGGYDPATGKRKVRQLGTFGTKKLELRPTFGQPHYSVILPGLDDGVIRLMTCQTVERDNPHYLPPEAQP